MFIKYKIIIVIKTVKVNKAKMNLVKKVCSLIN